MKIRTLRPTKLSIAAWKWWKGINGNYSAYFYDSSDGSSWDVLHLESASYGLPPICKSVWSFFMKISSPKQLQRKKSQSSGQPKNNNPSWKSFWYSFSNHVSVSFKLNFEYLLPRSTLFWKPLYRSSRNVKGVLCISSSYYLHGLLKMTTQTDPDKTKKRCLSFGEKTLIFF